MCYIKEEIYILDLGQSKLKSDQSLASPYNNKAQRDIQSPVSVKSISC